MDNTFVDLAPYLMATTIVGMILCFQIVRMVLRPSETREEKRQRRQDEKKRKRGVPVENKPVTVDQEGLERLLDRAETLGHRVGILEEIMTEDMKKKTPADS